MAAEHNLRAANASIGAARAAFFPSISLNAGVGSISPEMNELFGTSRNGYWSIGPTISVPIFNGGRLKGSLDLAKIQTEAQSCSENAGCGQCHSRRKNLRTYHLQRL